MYNKNNMVNVGIFTFDKTLIYMMVDISSKAASESVVSESVNKAKEQGKYFGESDMVRSYMFLTNGTVIGFKNVVSTILKKIDGDSNEQSENTTQSKNTEKKQTPKKNNQKFDRQQNNNNITFDNLMPKQRGQGKMSFSSHKK